MFKSIRWTLQLWHAGILAAAVAAIGAAGYLHISSTRYRALDSELDAAAQALVMRVTAETLPPRTPAAAGPVVPSPAAATARGRRDFRRPNRPGGRDADDFNSMADGDDGPRRGFVGAGGVFGPQRPEPKLPDKMGAPADLLTKYKGSDADRRSFVVWHGDRLIGNWGDPLAAADLPVARLPGQGQTGRFDSAGNHQVVAGGPLGSYVMVRSSVRPIEQELHAFIVSLAMAAGGILVIGLAGGWVVSRWALRPIGNMTTTAGSLSAQNLSGRIDVHVVPTELRMLATVLNGTFERLEHSFARQVRFTADASHELRTPLAVIHSTAELALTRDRSADEYRRTVEVCHSAAKRMRSLTDSLLLLAHADAGELAIEHEPFDLSEVILEGVELLDAAAVAAGVTVTTDIRPLVAVGDPVRMGQVVVNLVGNAIRYNKPGGTVAVRIALTDSDVLLTVADTGVGISPDDLPLVFDRFFRVDKARTATGSGLGAAICKSIVEAHGGSIAVASTPGVGTTFTVRLPRPTDTDEPDTSSSQTVAATIPC